MTPPTPIDADDHAARHLTGWRRRLYAVIFESDTVAGRRFDQALIVAILVSILVVMADSIQALHIEHGTLFSATEWVFTLLFTAEYLARLLCSPRPLKYATSFFGLIDLAAVMPTYLALFFPELYALIDVRVLRLLRVFRIFKLAAYLEEYLSLGRALAASKRKILVFLTAVMMVVLVMGTVMYVVEGPQHGFTSIPTSVYWAISTVTTVGFGDITPKTDLGRLISSFMMLLGWGILAVPTGIVTAEMSAQRRSQLVAALQSTPGATDAPPAECHECGFADHPGAARFCAQCGSRLLPTHATPHTR